MRHAMGATLPPSERIKVGAAATQDPILSAASLMASNLLLQSVRKPKDARLEWLRVELNKAELGLGDRAKSKVLELLRKGTPANQALFDGLRLAIANQFAGRLAKMAEGDSLRGLGSSERDINAVFCGVIGTTGTGGSVASALLTNPAGSAAIGTATTGIMGANSCNADALRAQAELTRAQAELAAAQAAGGGAMINASADSNTILYVALGLGALAVLGGGFLLLKKK